MFLLIYTDLNIRIMIFVLPEDELLYLCCGSAYAESSMLSCHVSNEDLEGG